MDSVDEYIESIFAELEPLIDSLPQLDGEFLEHEWQPTELNWMTATATVEIPDKVIVDVGLARASFMQVIEMFTYDLHKVTHHYRGDFIPFPESTVEAIEDRHVIKITMTNYPREIVTTLQCLAIGDFNNLTELIVQSSEALSRKLCEVVPGHKAVLEQPLGILHAAMRTGRFD